MSCSFWWTPPRLCDNPVLSFPDYTKSFILDIDASDTGLGAVISQLDESGHEHVIAYGNHLLSRTERKTVTLRELLAAVTFVTNFRPYLLGRRFTLTDHGSLIWLRNFREPEGQLARWLEILRGYDSEIVHRKGRLHCNADALFQIPCDSRILKKDLLVKMMLQFKPLLLWEGQQRISKYFRRMIHFLVQWKKLNQTTCNPQRKNRREEVYPREGSTNCGTSYNWLKEFCIASSLKRSLSPYVLTSCLFQILKRIYWSVYMRIHSGDI